LFKHFKNSILLKKINYENIFEFVNIIKLVFHDIFLNFFAFIFFLFVKTLFKCLIIEEIFKNNNSNNNNNNNNNNIYIYIYIKF